MGTVRVPHGRRGVAVILLACLVIGVTAVHATCRGAEQNNSSTENPMDDFASEYAKLKQQLKDLPKTIDDTGTAVERNTNANTTKQQIDSLRSIVSNVLSQVADNGSISRMGQAALNYANAKLKESENDTHFTSEQRSYLVAQWKTRVASTVEAVKGLEEARRELAGLLQSLQSNEDFLQELEALNNAAQTVEVLRTLTKDLREISGHLRNIIQHMAVPSM